MTMQPDTRVLSDSRRITLSREAVGMLLASAQAVYQHAHQRGQFGATDSGLRHLWALSEAIAAAERAILESADA